LGYNVGYNVVVWGRVVRPENSVRGLQGDGCQRVLSATNQMADSGWKASIAAQSGADKRRKCL